MLNPNLLPQNEKQNLRYEFRTRAVVSVGLLVTAILAISCILLLPSLFLLSFQKAEVVRALGLSEQYEAKSGLREARRKIAAINHEAEAAVKNFDSRPGAGASALLRSLLEDVPDAILFQRIEFRRSASRVAISGYAPTRTAFLEFLNMMQKNPRVKDVASPVANVIHEADITFSIVLTIQPVSP